MSVANVSDLGCFLGLYEVETPSGQTVSISPQEEAEIAKKALQWKLEQDLMATERLKQTAIESGFNAIGNIIGLTLGGLLLGRVLGVRPLK